MHRQAWTLEVDDATGHSRPNRPCPSEIGPQVGRVTSISDAWVVQLSESIRATRYEHLAVGQ
jgi:hypothetical protein